MWDPHRDQQRTAEGGLWGVNLANAGGGGYVKDSRQNAYQGLGRSRFVCFVPLLSVLEDQRFGGGMTDSPEC